MADNRLRFCVLVFFEIFGAKFSPKIEVAVLESFPENCLDGPTYLHHDN